MSSDQGPFVPDVSSNTPDGIHREINSIRSLRTRLDNKLISLNLLASGTTHTLDECVRACRNLPTGIAESLTSYWYLPGSAALATNITPASIGSSAVGFYHVTVRPNTRIIYSDVILNGHTILGITGTGVTSYVGPRVEDGPVQFVPSNVIRSQEITFATTWIGTNKYVHIPKQILIYKRAGTGSDDPYENGKLVVTSVVAIRSGDIDSTVIQSATCLTTTGNPAYPGHPATSECTSVITIALEDYFPNQPGLTLRYHVSSTSSNVLFDGQYYAMLID